jgi:hypothetical protein
VVYYTTLGQLDPDLANGDPPSPVFIPEDTAIANASAIVTPLSITILSAGDYIITAEFVMDSSGGGEPPEEGIGTNKLNYVGYELWKNNTNIPNTARAVKIKSGTPSVAYNSFSVQSFVQGLQVNDVITLRVSNKPVISGEATSAIIGIMSGSMIARK